MDSAFRSSGSVTNYNFWGLSSLFISIANQKNYTRTMMLDKLQISFIKAILSSKERKW